MAEGMAQVNQQVVEPGYWKRSESVAPGDACPAPAAADMTERSRRRVDVRRAIEADIVPRVFLKPPQVAARGAAGGAADGIHEEDVLRLAGLLLKPEHDDVVADFLSGIKARGVPIAGIYLELFQPAARHIGELWADDRCTFVDVTLAIGTLQKMLRAFGPAFHKNGRPPEGDRQALLLPLPGDQHTFGLSMLTEFFRRGGWSVWSTPIASFAEIGEAVRSAWFAVVGFSASTDSRLDELAVAIRAIREQSCNRTIGVMVGGPIFVQRPDYVGRVGADAMGVNAVQALARAERFVSLAAPS